MKLSIESLELRQLTASVCDLVDDDGCTVADMFHLLGAADNWQMYNTDIYDIAGQRQPGEGMLVSYVDIDAAFEQLGADVGDFNLDGHVDGLDRIALIENNVAAQFEADRVYWGYRWELTGNLDDGNQLWNAELGLQETLTVSYLRDRGVDLFTGDTRNATKVAFVNSNGDANNDGVFDSADFVQLGVDGGLDDVATSELVRLFQIGGYQS